MKYRKKSIVIEAIHFIGDNAPEIYLWSGGKIFVHPIPYTPCEDYLTIGTLEGHMVARPGDYIIRGIIGN